MTARGDLRQMSSQVLSLLEPELTRDGFEILDVRVFQGGGRVQVRIYVDLYPDGGITLDQCTRAGRTVNMLMEEADLFSGMYILEVSSPGIRRPLRLPRHFEAAVGQRVDLKLSAQAGRKRLRGVLTAFDGRELQVQPPAPADAGADGGEAGDNPAEEIVTVNLGAIQEANLDPEFDAKALINADRRRRKEERRQQRQSRKKTKRSRPRADRVAEDDSSSHDES